MHCIEDKSEAIGVTKDSLMENAGAAIASFVVSKFGPVKDVNVLALIGGGGNGSDGYIVSRYLADQGANVTAIKLIDKINPKEQSAKMSGVVCLENDFVSNDEVLKDLVKKSSIVIDAVLGIGVNRKIDGQLRHQMDIIEKNTANIPVVAIDLPSGLGVDTGNVDTSVIKADVTAALGFLKMCHVVQPGALLCGDVSVLNIGIPSHLREGFNLDTITETMVAPLLPERPDFSHKGMFGKLLVVGGSENFIGAPTLASGAAYRSGTGLVTVACQRSIASTLLSLSPEATLLQMDETSNGDIDGWRSAIGITQVLDNYSAMLVGCGLGINSEKYKLIRNLILSGLKGPPIIIDADGLNLIAKFYKWWERIPDEVILTPHLGEMSRLTGLPIDEIQGDPLGISRFYSNKWNKIVVLKDAHTIIAASNGDAFINEAANPALASAGTGDVLAGIIGGLIAQRVPLLSAAILGVYIHSRSASNVSENVGVSGLLASDLLPEIPVVMEKLRRY